MARTSTRRWKGCQLCKPWKFAGYGNIERIPTRELRRMGGRRRRVGRKDAGTTPAAAVPASTSWC